MKRLFCFTVSLFACLLLLSSPAAPQEIIWQGGVGFGGPNGSQVRHGVAITPKGAVKLDGDAQMLHIGSAPGDTAPITRALKLPDGRAIVYGLAVKRLDNGARYEVTLREQDTTLPALERLKIDPARVEKGFLSKYTQPLLINDGDMLALDVLVDPRTNAKITDFFLISNGPPLTRKEPEKLKAEARELALNDLALTVTGYQVRRNGEIVYPRGGGVSGRFIYLDIPEVGRAFFTITTPPSGSGFTRIAIVNEKQLLFSIGADQYELLSRELIIPAEGSFYVWMLLDPVFSIPALPPNPPAWAKGRGKAWGSAGAMDRWPTGKEDEQ